MLRRLASKVRPGGVVVFHEIDWGGLSSFPSVALSPSFFVRFLMRCPSRIAYRMSLGVPLRISSIFKSPLASRASVVSSQQPSGMDDRAHACGPSQLWDRPHAPSAARRFRCAQRGAGPLFREFPRNGNKWRFSKNDVSSARMEGFVNALAVVDAAPDSGEPWPRANGRYVLMRYPTDGCLPRVADE